MVHVILDGKASIVEHDCYGCFVGWQSLQHLVSYREEMEGLLALKRLTSHVSPKPHTSLVGFQNILDLSSSHTFAVPMPYLLGNALVNLLYMFLNLFDCIFCYIPLELLTTDQNTKQM